MSDAHARREPSPSRERPRLVKVAPGATPTSRRRVAYGPHLHGDLADCNSDKMRDGEFIYLFMLDVVRVTGMNPIGSPHLDLYSGPHQEWAGFSATIHIQTSHITAHFFAFGYVFLDIFSCRPFDRRKARCFIEAELEPQGAVRWRELQRGSTFPQALIDPLQLRAQGFKQS